MSVFTGSHWSRDRLADVLGLDKDSEERWCRRCTLNVPETNYHRFWQCPCNKGIKACAPSEHLRAQAAKSYEKNPHLWLRGLAPLAWAAPPDDYEPPADTYFGIDPKLQEGHTWQGITVAAGDASGGEHTADPRVRRVAWAAVVLNVSGGLRSSAATTWEPVWSSTGAVLGRQTINRGSSWRSWRP